MPLESALVLQSLIVWEKTFGNGRETVDHDLVRVWKGVLDTRDVTEEELKTVSVEVAAVSRFMPKPAEVLEIVARLRADRRRALAPRLVIAIDPRGDEVFAPADEVDEHGRLIVPGRPMLPPPAPALPAPPLTRDEVRERFKAMSPIARRSFLTLLRLDRDRDTSMEIEVVREIEADERAEAEAEIERRDRAHDARVRDQARRMREAKAE